MTPQALALERCLANGGVALFPADTVYGLGCDPDDLAAVERLYALKGRPADKPSAVMFMSREALLDAVPELGPRIQTALERLTPGGVSLLVPNPASRFPLACAGDPATLGLRVPNVPLLAGVSRPLLQSSANLSGGPDPRRLDEVPGAVRDGADLAIDGGELPGTPSTLIDLRAYEEAGEWTIVRAGAVSADQVARALL